MFVIAPRSHILTTLLCVFCWITTFNLAEAYLCLPCFDQRERVHEHFALFIYFLPFILTDLLLLSLIVMHTVMIGFIGAHWALEKKHYNLFPERSDARCSFCCLIMFFCIGLYIFSNIMHWHSYCSFYCVNRM